MSDLPIPLRVFIVLVGIGFIWAISAVIRDTVLDESPKAVATDWLARYSTPLASITPRPTATATVTNTPTSTPFSAIEGQNINSRACPSTTCEVVAVLSSEDEIIILSQYEDWYLVQLSDEQTAYIKGDLLTLPDDLEVAIVPTVTNTPIPSPTRRPTNTPTRRPTQTPVVLDERTLEILAKAGLLSQGIQLTSLNLYQGVLTIDVSNSVTNTFTGDRETLVPLTIGSVTGVVVAAYQDEFPDSTPPRTIEIEFRQDRLLLLRVSYSYADARSYFNGQITTTQFLNRVRSE